jgi:hypothetical protein
VRAEKREVARCWHPLAPVAFLDMPRGYNVAVCAGQPAYQLSNGEIITL